MFNPTLSLIALLVTLSVIDAQYAPRRGRAQYRQATYAAAPAPVAAAAAPVRYANNAPLNSGAYNAGPEENYPPQPHNFNYEVNDEYGNQRYHQENGDGSGRVTGSYGYRDAYGVYRYVDYVADENGFRATIRSNEPGMENPAPAGVTYALEQPPAQVYLGAPKAASQAAPARNYRS